MLTYQPSLTLTTPAEPTDLRASLRDLLARSPAEGQCLLDTGDWLACPLWDTWGEELTASGWHAERLREVVIAYRHELRLWVIGERPWAHVAAGLIGRIERRSYGR